MTFKIRKLETEQEIEDVAALAKEIWTEYYTTLIGAPQTEYMIRVFQSPERIKKDIQESNYSYFAVFSDNCEEQTAGCEKQAEGCKEQAAGCENQAAYLALHPDEKGVFISKIYVKKEYRRRGIAKMLIAFALDFAKAEIKSPTTVYDKKNNRPCLWLSVNKGNSGSIEFYKTEGFELTEGSVKEIGDGFYTDDYIMTLYFDA